MVKNHISAFEFAQAKAVCSNCSSEQTSSQVINSKNFSEQSKPLQTSLITMRGLVSLTNTYCLGWLYFIATQIPITGEQICQAVLNGLTYQKYFLLVFCPKDA